MVSFSAFPGPSGNGSVSVSPAYTTRSRASAIRTPSTYSRVRWSWRANPRPWPPPPPPRAGQGHPHAAHVLARPLGLPAEPRPVPALAPLGPARADPEQHPPVRELIDRRRGHRRHGRAATGHLEDRRAELDLRRRLG